MALSLVQQFRVFWAIAVLGAGLPAFADGARVSRATLTGTACPSGSYSVTVSPDQTAISILFDRSSVEAGTAAGVSAARKTCDIQLPIQIAQGFDLESVLFDYRGYASVPEGGVARLKLRHDFAGAAGRGLGTAIRRLVMNEQSRTLPGGYSDEYLYSQLMEADDTPQQCVRAETLNLRVSVTLEAQSNASNDQTLLTLDSIDGTPKTNITYRILTRRCEQNRGGGVLRRLPGLIGSRPAVGAGQELLELACASQNDARAECEVKREIRRVSLKRRVSSAACVEGSSYGFSGRQVWVDRGCRAEFYVVVGDASSGGTRAPQIKKVRCESQNAQAQNCEVGSRILGLSVDLRFSRSACVEGQSYGFEGSQIWVRNGCRAQFTAVIEAL